MHFETSKLIPKTENQAQIKIIDLNEKQEEIDERYYHNEFLKTVKSFYFFSNLRTYIPLAITTLNENKFNYLVIYVGKLIY